MPRKTTGAAVTQRAWRLLRLALLWARKGGVFKRRLVMELRILPKLIRSIGHSGSAGRRDAIWYGERELSFDDTPIFHVRMNRPGSMRFRMPHIPCINPPVSDFDYEFEEQEEDAEKMYYGGGGGGGEMVPCCEEESIDKRAEEFIAKFYQQMKMQRQISYLQYGETTPSRGSVS